MTKDRIDDTQTRKQQLDREFENLPETIIQGVVGANGPGAGKVPADEFWTLNLTLIAWREQGQAINHSALSLSKSVSDSELKAIQLAVKKESLIQFKARLSKHSPFGDARAQLIELIGTPDDPELEAALTAYQQPVEIEHPQLGTFVLDKSVDWFEGTVPWMGTAMSVSVSLDEQESPQPGFKTIEALCADTAHWSKKITDYAVAELLPLKNENWLDEGQQSLSPEEFIEAMELISITVYPDGEFEFWHNDGDLFWGHSILISGSLENGPDDADIPG